METVELLLQRCKKKYNEDSDIEVVLKFLRNSGASKTESLYIIKRIKKISGGDAKRIVHFSETWSDLLKEDTAFHEALEKQLDEL